MFRALSNPIKETPGILKLVEFGGWRVEVTCRIKISTVSLSKEFAQKKL